LKKTVIITGANRGLGKGFVDVLIQDKECFIISISRRLSEEQKQYSSDRFFFLEMDLAQDDIHEKLGQLKGKIGTEALYYINNASIIEPISKIEKLDEQSIDKIIAVNVKATVMLAQYVLKNYSQNQLTLVNISSGAANRPIDNWSLYCSSKAFNQMFFNVAESEYQQHRFFNINPGVLDTGMQKDIRESDFPDVEKFKELQKGGQLKSPIEAAKEILETIEFKK
jgi:benzil reductase ((S)-benzoin forming)